jgi:hypothetical protein
MANGGKGSAAAKAEAATGATEAAASGSLIQAGRQAGRQAERNGALVASNRKGVVHFIDRVVPTKYE